MSTLSPILEVEDLRTHFFTDTGCIKAVDGMSFSVAAGEVLGLAGESGSGKSMTALSILRLIAPPARVVGGAVRFKGRDLLHAESEDLRKLRGDRIAMIFQDPMSALNPVLTIGAQMVETIQAHEAASWADASARATAMLAKVGVSAPDERLRQYPHQLSGGMRQRVAIAIAMLLKPELILADEPTTALDVTVQSQILFEMRRLCRETGAALIWITHDLGVLAAIADRILVMYAGRLVESGPARDVLTRPGHPYTAGLIASLPHAARRGRTLTPISGAPPSLADLPEGCSFRPRCPDRDAMCFSDPTWTALDASRIVRCFHPNLALPSS